MKNKFIALALVTLSIATTTVSCTKDDSPLASKAENVQTAKLSVPVKVADGSSMTGKSVNRGTLPVSIDEIDVTATSNQFTNWAKMTPFVLVNDAVGTVTPYGVVEGAFNLDNVAVGSNTISVVTKTNAVPSFIGGVSGSDANTLMGVLRQTPPYAVYMGSATANVIQGQANALDPITLTAKNGRNIAVFQLDANLTALGVTATISPMLLNSNTPAFTTFTVTSDKSGYIYFNLPVNTPADKNLTFAVTLNDAHGVALPSTSQIPNSTITLTQTAMVSTNVIYTIAQSGLTGVPTTETFSASWTDGAPTNGHIGN